MTRDIRIKEYLFLQASGNNAGSQNTQYTNHVLNGELLRVDSFGNYTGSLIIRQSGLTSAFLNTTATSGPSNWTSFSFSNTTGSFMINSILEVTVSGLASGTTTKFGPINILYR